YVGGHEPTVQELVASGADLVCFSGDKLLGGPQAGICVGSREYVKRLKRNQMFRMLRCDKITLALLEATLRLYRDPERVWKRVPTLRMITESLPAVRERAVRLAGLLNDIKGAGATVVEHQAFVGGGSLPDEQIASAAVSLTVRGFSVDQLSTSLRMGEPSVFGRIDECRYLLDCRTVADDDLGRLHAAVAR